METYIIKFWVTNEEGFRKQLEVKVDLKTNSKNDHNKAASVILQQYRKQNPEIVGVRYA